MNVDVLEFQQDPLKTLVETMEEYFWWCDSIEKSKEMMVLFGPIVGPHWVVKLFLTNHLQKFFSCVLCTVSKTQFQASIWNHFTPT